MVKSAKPRIHWISPVPPAETDIAHYTHRILPELAEVAELVLWTDAAEWDWNLHNIAPVRHLDPDRVRPRDFALSGRAGRGPEPGAEVVFVNIGNAWPFHAGFLRMIQRLPTIVVLHDMTIQELCFDGMERGLLDQDVYLENMRRAHGQAGVEAAKLVLGHEMGAGALARTYPGFELALTHAVSVVTHSRVAQQSVDTVSDVPTYLLDLPFRPSLRRPEVYRSGLGPLRLVQFGYTGPNRRLESVLRALASLKHEVDFCFDVMGKLWDTGYLRNLVNQLGIESRVTFHGFVDEGFLDQKLQQAHLVFNLRSPTMGEASGSQLRIWNACAASVVTNLGWYADLPDETVFKINPDREAEELKSIVRSLYADPSRGNGKALAGRERLEQIHNPARYAAAIKKVAEKFSQDAAHSLLGSRCSFPGCGTLNRR